MDTAVTMIDPERALDLANIRFQLMYLTPNPTVSPIHAIPGYTKHTYKDENIGEKKKKKLTECVYSRLEDTITFHLIERVQFPLSKAIYEAGGVTIPGSQLSLMDYLLREQERLQSRVRRFQSPDEYPFFPDALETPILQPLQYPKILHENDVNVNQTIKERYIREILPDICPPAREGYEGETQENYGSASTCDVNCLQALSRRIHFGKFVAESKFRKEPERFVKMIKANDRAGIDEAITNTDVEKKVLDRLGLKAKTYGTDPAFAEESGSKIPHNAVVSMYKVCALPFPCSCPCF